MYKKVIHEEHDGMLIRQFLKQEMSFSKNLIKQAKSEEGMIAINGEKKTVRYVLKAGDELTVTLPNERKQSQLTGQYLPLNIIFEDDHIIVLNKPAGIPVIPSRLYPRETIANGLIYYYEKKQLPYTVHIVTRLDKDTSGLMLIAKHRQAHYLLSEQLKKEKVTRKYKALVHGRLAKESDRICAPIGRKEGSFIEREVNEAGKVAITQYKVLSVYDDLYSLVLFQLETGRTHQIRVHASYIGHPLLGDNVYGGSTNLMRRQALHCHMLTFTHPIDQEEMTFDIPLASDMEELVTSC